MKTIGVFTGNRAEFGLLLPVIREIERHHELCLRLYVAGGHLDASSSETIDEILQEGVEIFREIRIAEYEDSPAGKIGRITVAITDELTADPPDFFVVYADRYEGFAAVIAASQSGVVTVHMEGGDVTEGGCLDDSVRHAMTKLSHIHFATNEAAKNRILGMGEEAWRVFNVGLPALDVSLESRLLSESEICLDLGLDLSQPIVVLTFHPINGFPEKVAGEISVVVEAVKRLGDQGVQVVATYPNNDAGFEPIIDALSRCRDEWQGYFNLIPSLGRKRYHSLLNLASNPNIKICCLGNSSSGIKEAPIFNCPVVNIGNRQLGRLRASNVIDVEINVDQIVGGVESALAVSSSDRTSQSDNPYGTPGVGRRVAEILANFKLHEEILVKKMTLQGIEKNGWFR